MDERQLQESAELLKAIAHPTRLHILCELRKAPQCVHAMEDILPVSQVNVSQHLSVLRRAGLVNYVQEGALRCYYLARPGLTDTLCDALAQGGEPIRRTKDDVRREREEKGICAAPKTK